MKRNLIAAWTTAIVLACAGSALADTPLAVKNLRCEYKTDPLGIDVQRPRLSWERAAAEYGFSSTARRKAAIDSSVWRSIIAQ